MKTIHFLGKDRPIHFSISALEDYADLLGLSGIQAFASGTPIQPTKLLYVGMKWGALKASQPFDLGLDQVRLAFDDEAVEIEQLSNMLTESMTAYNDKVEKKMKAATKR